MGAQDRRCNPTSNLEVLVDADLDTLAIELYVNYYGAGFEITLADGGICLLRPARHGEAPRPGASFFNPRRQIIESVNDTLMGQLDLERHGGHTPAGVLTRVLQRILALTAAIWHNDRAGQPVMRSLIAYDH